MKFDSESEMVIPPEVAPFIPKPYKVLSFEKGDLNNDKLDDYIIVLANPKDFKEELYRDSEDTQVPTLFLLRQSNGILQLRHKSDVLFRPAHINGGTSANISIDEGGTGFTVQYRFQHVYASGMWSEKNAHFTYNRKRGDWILDTVAIAGGANSSTYQMEQLYIRKAEEIGDTAFLKHVEENGFPYSSDVLESFTVMDSVNEVEMPNGGEEDYRIYTKKHFGHITLSKFKGEDWLYSLQEKYKP